MITIMNLIIPLIFITMTITYIYIAYNNGIKIIDEIVLLSIFAIIFLCNCFIFSNLGFISLPTVNNVTYTYLILCYCGTKFLLKYLYQNSIPDEESIKLLSPEKYRKYLNRIIKFKDDYNKLFEYYWIITSIFGFLFLTCNQFAIIYRDNLFIILPKLIIPFYTGTMAFISIKIKNNVTGIFLLNLNIFAFFISLYEPIDFIVFMENKEYYSTWQKFYIDPTYSWDTIWLLVICVCWLFIPRIIYAIKNRKK